MSSRGLSCPLQGHVLALRQVIGREYLLQEAAAVFDMSDCLLGSIAQRAGFFLYCFLRRYTSRTWQGQYGRLCPKPCGTVYCGEHLAIRLKLVPYPPCLLGPACRLDFAASYLQRKQSGGSGEDWEAGIINAAGRGAPTVSRREITGHACRSDWIPQNGVDNLGGHA